jgi:hypothetical protein
LRRKRTDRSHPRVGHPTLKPRNLKPAVRETKGGRRSRACRLFDQVVLRPRARFCAGAPRASQNARHASVSIRRSCRNCRYEPFQVIDPFSGLARRSLAETIADDRGVPSRPMSADIPSLDAIVFNRLTNNRHFDTPVSNVNFEKVDLGLALMLSVGIAVGNLGFILPWCCIIAGLRRATLTKKAGSWNVKASRASTPKLRSGV